MKNTALNLARRPFVNTRPVARLAILLWVLGAALLALNFNAYRDYFSGSGDRQAEIEALDRTILDHETEITRLKSSLRGMNLHLQNEQVDFLNHKIAERTFSWSQLFDHLEEVLPRDVRIFSLTPRIEGQSRRRRGQVGEQRFGERVELNLTGISKTVEAELEFLDRLFEHVAFEQPRLANDSQDSSGSRFVLAVSYLPTLPSREEAAAAAPARTAGARSGEPEPAQQVAALRPGGQASTGGNEPPGRGATGLRGSMAIPDPTRVGVAALGATLDSTTAPPRNAPKTAPPAAPTQAPIQQKPVAAKPEKPAKPGTSATPQPKAPARAEAALPPSRPAFGVPSTQPRASSSAAGSERPTPQVPVASSTPELQ